MFGYFGVKGKVAIIRINDINAFAFNNFCVIKVKILSIFEMIKYGLGAKDINKQICRIASADAFCRLKRVAY